MADVADLDAVAGDLFGAFITPEARENPYPLYASLRADAPVLDSGVGLWLLSRHADVRAVLRDSRCSSDESNSTINQAIAAEQGPDVPIDAIDSLGLLVFMDPPDHTRLRGLVSRAFTPRRIGELRPRIEEVTDALLSAASPSDPLDVISDYAYPLATTVICELLGVPLADREIFGRWSTDVARAVDPSAIRTDEVNAAVNAGSAAFLEYFSAMVDDRRRSPGDDLLSDLLTAEEDGDRLSRDELLSMGLLLLIAGHETTINLIGNAMLALLDDRRALAQLQADPTLDHTAVDEFLRFDSPVQITQRIPVEDIEIGGETVPAGAALIVLLGAANRDPSVFAQPDRLDLTRADNAHVAFGGGIHHCLGAALARTEGEVAIGKLIRSATEFELVEAPARRSTFTLRGLESLKITRR